MTYLYDMVRSGESSRQRFSQLRQTISPQQARAMAGLAGENPSLSPGALAGLGMAGVQAGTPASRAAGQADVEVKRDSGNFFQRALAKTVRGVKIAGGAVLPDFVGDAANATVGSGFMKGVSRGVDMGLSSINQTVQGTVRAATDDGFQLSDIASGFRQTDMYQGHREVQREGGYVGLLTGKTDVDFGSGYFAGGDPAREAGAARARATDVRIGGHMPTVGRLLAKGIGLEPGGTAFSIVSGIPDLMLNLGLDPTTYTPGITRRLADKRLFAGAASSGFDAAGAAAKVDRGLAQARSEQFDTDLMAEIGAIDGIRKTVNSDRVLEWLTSKQEGQEVVSYLAKETDFGKLYDATKGKLPPDLLVKLTEREMTGDEVIALLGPKLGRTARTDEKFRLDPVARADSGTGGLGTLATAKFKTRVRDTRIFGTVPERVLPKGDASETLKNADAFMRNALIKKGETFDVDGKTLSRSDILRRLAEADGSEGMLDVTIDMMKMGTQKAISRGIDPEKARSLFKVYKDSEEGRRAFWQEQVVVNGQKYWQNRGFNVTDEFVNGDPSMGPRALPHLASHFLDNNIPLPDPREIRAELSKFSGILSNPAIKVSKNALNVIADNVFKPGVLLRPAYVARNQIDEQFRPAGAGLNSLMSHPVQYMQWLMTDQAGVGKALAASSGGRFKSRGATFGPDGQFFDETGERIRRAAQGVKAAKDSGDQAAFDAAQLELQAARQVRQSITPFTDGVSAFERSITGGLGNWRNRAYSSINGNITFNKQDPSFSRALGEGLHRIFNDPIARRIAAGEDLDQIKADFWRGPLQGFRGSLAKQDDRMAFLNDEIGASQYIDDTVDYVKTFTGDSNELRAAAATGKVDGVPLTRGDTLEVHKAALERLDLLKQSVDFQGPDGVIGSNLIKGGGDEGNGYTRAVDWMFYQLADRPTRYLTKSPVFRQRYYKRMENLIGFMDEKAAGDLIESARVANLRPKDIARLEKKRTGGAGISFDEADLVAKTDALEFVNELLYSLHHRGQFFDVTRLLFPFGEAFLDSARKYSQLTAKNPVLPYRLQQVIEGARAADLNGDGEGFFYTDEQTGEEMFAIPGSGALLQGLGKIPGLQGIEGAGKFRAPVKNLNILGTTVIPGFGPVVQMAAGAVLPDTPDFNAIREIITPYGERSLEGGALESFLPSWFNKIRTSGILGEGLMSPAQQRSFAQAQKDMMGYLASTGEYNLQDPSGADQQRLMADAKSRARAVFVIRGMAQSFAPSPPSPEFVAYDKDGVLLTQFKLAEEYRKIQDEQRELGTPEATTRVFMETFGEQALLAIQPNTKAADDRSPINPNAEAKKFWQNNRQAAERFPTVFGLFSPDPEGADFDFATYNAQIKSGERVVVSPEEALKRTNQAVARMIYNNAKSYVGEDPTPEQRSALSQLKNKLAEDFPGYSTAFSNDTPAVLEDLKRAAQDPQLSRSDVGQALNIWLRARDAAEASAQSQFGVGWRTADASRPVRDRMRALAEQLGSDFPGFTEMYERALEREMARD